MHVVACHAYRKFSLFFFLFSLFPFAAPQQKPNFSAPCNLRKISYRTARSGPHYQTLSSRSTVLLNEHTAFPPRRNVRGISFFFHVRFGLRILMVVDRSRQTRDAARRSIQMPNPLDIITHEQARTISVSCAVLLVTTVDEKKGASVGLYKRISTRNG